MASEPKKIMLDFEKIILKNVPSILSHSKSTSIIVLNEILTLLLVK